MMFTSPKLLAKVLSGEKTVTRRKLAQGARYHAHMSYAVQPGRGVKHVGHVYVRSVRTQILGQVAARGETELEGFASYAEFKAYWRSLHGSYDPELRVVRIEFVLEPRGACCAAFREPQGEISETTTEGAPLSSPEAAPDHPSPAAVDTPPSRGRGQTTAEAATS